MGDEQVVQDVQHDVKIKDNINFTKKWLSGGKYEYSRIYNDEYGGQSVNLSAGATTKTTFELPAVVMNHHRSRLRFTLSNSALGAGITSWIWLGTIPIHQVVLQTLNGTRIASLDNLEFMTRLLAPVVLKEQEYAQLPIMPSIDGAVGNTTYSGVGILPAYASGPFAGNSMTDKRILHDGEPSAVTVAEGAIPYREGVEAVSGALNAIHSLSFDIPLRYLFESVFSVDQDSFYNEPMQLVVYFSDKSKISFQATSVSAPQTGTLANSGDLTLDNLVLLNAVETQEDIVRAIKEKAMSTGFEKIMPWTESWKRQISGTHDNDTTNIFPQSGGTLLRVYSALALTAEELNTNYNIDNLNNAKISVFQTSLDNRPLQQQLLNCPRDDWAFLADKLKGSNILSNNCYQHKHVFIDDFTGLRSSEFLENGSNVAGIPLTKKLLHNILYDTISAGNFYSYKFAVFQRRTITTSEGVVVLNSLE